MQRRTPDAGVDGPLGLFGLVAESSRRWLHHDAETLSAAMAFYAITSLAPILVIAVGLAGSVLGEETARTNLLDVLTVIVDPRAAALASDLLNRPWFVQTHPLGGSLAAVALVFASTAGFAHLRISLNRIWEVPEGDGAVKGALRGRALSFLLVLATGLLVLVSVLVRASLAAFGSMLENRLPFDFVLFRVIELALFFAALTLLFTLIFRYLPDRRTPWRHLLVGASLTSMLFLLGELVIGFYLGRVTPASAFGAVGSAVIASLWVYYSCMVFFWGAELTCVYAAGDAPQSDTRTTQPVDPPLVRSPEPPQQ